MVDNGDNDRLDHALKWCKKHKLKLDRLDLFNRERKKKKKKSKINPRPELNL